MRYGHPGNDALNKILERLEPHSLTSKRIPNIRLQNLIVESLCSLHYDDSLEFVIRVYLFFLLDLYFFHSTLLLYLLSLITFVVIWIRKHITVE